MSLIAYFPSGSDILSGQSLSARENRLSGHVENSPELTPVKDYSLGVQLNRHGGKHLTGNEVFTRVNISGDSMQLQGFEENDKSLTTEKAEIEQEKISSLAFNEGSRETNMYTAVSSESEKSSNSSMKSAISAKEMHQFPTLTSDGYLPDSNDSSLLSSSFEQIPVVADPSCTLQSSSDTTDGSPILTIASGPVLNGYPGMTGSSFADPSWPGAAPTLPGDPVYNAQRFSSTSNKQLTDPAHDANRFAGNDASSAFTCNQGTDEPAQKPNLALGNSRTTTGNIDDEANSSARYQLGNSTTFDGVLAARSTHDTSVLEPRLSDTDNSSVSVLNNTDFGTDSVEASDNSLLALERRVAEACALVERVLREREEREQFGREIERKEQLIREQRARERREREERELREAENWPQQQEAINARSQWLCEHYQRHCRVRFPCCTQFYPCHRCHNISKACDNEEAKACHATHLKCSHCQHEQEVTFSNVKLRSLFNVPFSKLLLRKVLPILRRS